MKDPMNKIEANISNRSKKIYVDFDMNNIFNIQFYIYARKYLRF